MAPDGEHHTLLGHPARTRVSSFGVGSAWSCRHLLLVVSLVVGLVTVPFLLVSPLADSCYVTRAPREMASEEAMALERMHAATGGAVVAPNEEAIESTPETGRLRSPTWFFQHQTLLMLALLLTLVVNKALYALWYMRPDAGVVTASVAGTTVDAFDVEHGSIRSSSHLAPPPPASTKSSSRRIGGTKGKTKKRSKTNTPNRTPPAVTREIGAPHTPTSVNGLDGDAAHAPLFRFDWWQIFRIVYAYMWYLAAYFLCAALKEILGDRACSTHGNSVSGHYLFHCYAVWLVAYIHLDQKHLHGTSLLSSDFWCRLVGSRRGVLDLSFLVLYPLYVFVVASILVDTYTFGFHSPRQIAYGSALAVVAFLAVTGVFEAVEIRVSRMRGYAQAKGVASATSATIDASSEVLVAVTTTDPDADEKVASPSFSLIASVLPSWASSSLSLLSTTLNEWLYADERSQRYYTFPLLALVAFQILAFILLASSPNPRRVRAPDLGALVVGFVALAWIWQVKLRMPRR